MFSESIVKIVEQTVEKILIEHGSQPFPPEEIFYDMKLKIFLLLTYGKMYVNIEN